MKKIISILSLLFLLVSCKKQDYDEFDFSFNNTFETDFSIKFNPNNDSVFIRQNWSSDDSKHPLSETNYISQLNKQQKKEFDSFINNTNFKSFDTLYFEKYSDGEYFSFFIKKDGLHKNIKVHSHHLPKSLVNFADWIYKTKKTLKLIDTQREFEFKSKIPVIKPPNSFIFYEQ
ncbi:hypothetical protein [Chryseobacterium chendengshani]|uniref:hypothetical protein n=1 Tax=Chryseobacterium sp. LJ756 TaxID=2864113 RepID=UPI001C6422AE|nr:hypothetical protein [Chryseobacterium sp. LJ756]MBW7676294.1 hypothetical protein [Chryseobacterium sp. LJ756]